MRSHYEKQAFLHCIFFLIIIATITQYMQKHITAVGSKLL